MMEKRSALSAQMEGIVKAAEAEERNLSNEEMAKFDALDNEVKELRASAARIERAEELKKLNQRNKPFVSGTEKPPAIAGRESGQKESSFKRKLETNNSPVPVQILFVLTPEQPSAPPASRVPNRK